jgi:epsilon-lactone hydrolase
MRKVLVYVFATVAIVTGLLLWYDSLFIHKTILGTATLVLQSFISQPDFEQGIVDDSGAPIAPSATYRTFRSIAVNYVAPHVKFDVESLRNPMFALPVDRNVNVTKVTIPGYGKWPQVEAEWVSVSPNAQWDRAIMWLHYGGYVCGSLAHSRRFASELSARTNIPVIMVNYRLAPEHAFPAMIEDAVSVYHHLVRGLKFKPYNIMIGGDSAGGAMVVSTLMVLRDGKFPLPAAGLSIAPWSDLTHKFKSFHRNVDKDFILHPDMLKFLRKTVSRAGRKKPIPFTHPQLSPNFGKFEGLPPLYIAVGEYEILRDSAAILAGRAIRAGVDVQYDEYEFGVHILHSFAGLIPEADDQVDRMATYINGRFIGTRRPPVRTPERRRVPTKIPDPPAPTASGIAPQRLKKAGLGRNTKKTTKTSPKKNNKSKSKSSKTKSSKSKNNKKSKTKGNKRKNKNKTKRNNKKDTKTKSAEEAAAAPTPLSSNTAEL